MEAVAPPAVLHLVRVQHTEAVGKAGIQQLGHFSAFLIGKACAHAVGLCIFDVDLPVSHIQVTAQDHWLLCIQPQQIGTESILPCHAVIQTLQAVLTVGGVAVDQIKLRIFQRQYAPLVVVLLDADAGGHGQRLPAAPAGRAGISLFLGRVCVLGVALRGKIRLTGLHFGLLYRKNVRIKRRKALGEAVGQAGAQAVNVPADQFHDVSPLDVMPDIWFSMHRCGSGQQSR